MADLFTEGSTASTDEEAATLLAGLDDVSLSLSGLGDEEDMLDLAALLGGVEDETSLDGASAGDSQSETEGVTEGAEEGNTEEAAVEADSEEVLAEAADEEATDEHAAEAAAPEAEAEATKPNKAVPVESSDVRVLRASHKFRVAVEPLIKDFQDDLPQIAGIATAIRGTDGIASLRAIEGYSESAASSIRTSVLEANAESYVAEKYGVAPEALATVFTKQPSISDTLKGELEYLTDESRAEVEALLKQPAVAGERDKILETKLATAVAELRDERESSVSTAVTMHFNQLLEKAKVEGKYEELEQIALIKIKANETAQGAIDSAYAAAREGRKNDTIRHLKTFNKQLAEIVKDMAGTAPKAAAPKVVAEEAVAPVVAKAPKAPVIKPQAQKAKAATAPVVQTPSTAGRLQGKDLDRHMLEFARAKSKEFGVGWRG